MSGTATAKATGVRFENTVPILRVGSLQASIDYYVEVLGFVVDWHEPKSVASVSRDGHGIMLCEGGQGNPGTWVWIGVSDSTTLFDEYTAKGATIRLPPTNYPWAYEMHVEDPDGHVLRLGSDPLVDRPFVQWVS
jgi:catechol 2,3-dioxygenase-like lactoylglutathione lyase family enzyme